MNTSYKYIAKQCTVLLTVASLLMSNLAYAAQPVLSTTPLGATAGSVKPNLMFILDSSGSMASELPNETLNDYGQCKAAVKNIASVAINRFTIGSTLTKPANSNNVLTIYAPGNGKNVGDNIYLAIPGKPTLSGVYKVTAVNNAVSGCLGTNSSPIVHDLVKVPSSGDIAPVKVNPTSHGATSAVTGTVSKVGPIADTTGSPGTTGVVSVNRANVANVAGTTGVVTVNRANVADVAGTTGVVSIDKANVANVTGAVTKVGETPYIPGSGDGTTPETFGCAVITSQPANSGNTTTDLNLGGGVRVGKFGPVPSVSNSACYWQDAKDTPGCTLGATPAHSNTITSITYTNGTNNGTGASDSRCRYKDTPNVAGTPGCTLGAIPTHSNSSGSTIYINGTNNGTGASDSRCRYQDTSDTAPTPGIPGCSLGAAPTHSTTITTNTYHYGTNNSTGLTDTRCYYLDHPDTAGCTLGSSPGNSGSNTTSYTYGTNTKTGLTDTSCYWKDWADTYGCKVTTSQPANDATNFTTDVNKGGGYVVDGNNVVTSTTSASCYWKDPHDDAPGSVCTGGTGILTNASIEVAIAGESAGTYTLGSDSEATDAYLTSQLETSTCVDEPPLRSVQVNSLAYDPAVSYQPPPSPIKVGQGKPAPLPAHLTNLNGNSSSHNLLPSMTNWNSVRVDGTKLDSSGNQVSATVDFTKMKELVFCDTPARPASFSSDKAWYESSRCQHNTTASNTALSSPTWPYKYPEITSGLANTPNQTNWLSSKAEHQNGQSVGTKNPIFDFGGNDFYAFGRTYYDANPYYYKITPIEYCAKGDLKTCNIQSSEDATYPFPSYVRYCKTRTQATDLTGAQSGNCQATNTGNIDGTDFKFARYGLMTKVELKTGNTYPKTADRTDCSGSVGASGCSFSEEMTNYANWYSYYRTRMQLMKTASGRAFNFVDDGKFRVGLMTVDQNFYLPIKDFDSGAGLQKQKWFQTMYDRVPSGGTPLREALATVGRVFAGKNPLGLATSDDPMQYSCQLNYTLLTTDGYWNGSEGLTVDGGSYVGNQDSDVTTVFPPQREAASPNDAPDSLSDVAMYYYKTDLRDTGFSNCTGNLGNDVCLNDAKDATGGSKHDQYMKTYTLGLGVDGNLNYSRTYETDTSGDFADIKAGVTGKFWPKPVADNGTAPLTTSELATVDDLWHAAVNGRGQYINAKNPDDVKNGVINMLESIGKTTGAGSAAAVSNRLPVTGYTEYAYNANFITGDWTGNLYARTVDNSGNLSASAAWCVENEDSVTPACIGSLKSKVSPSSDTRKIYTNVGGTLKSFEYSNLDTTQKSYFDNTEFSSLSQWGTFTTAQKSQVTGDSLVDYLRGQSEFDDDEGHAIDDRLFRQRTKVLGDIVDSPTIFVGKAELVYTDPGYSAFVTKTISGTATDTTGANRSTSGRTIYVGANDGMLHAFNANDGTERWAFVPDTVLPNMWKLADKDYKNKHTNYVNGPLEVTDICTANCNLPTATWKTILVSGLGQGGRGYFALDVTDPSKPSLLWEINSSTISDLGYSYGKPVVTKLADSAGTWVVLLTSGYNNTSPGDGEGHLFVVDANTGSLLKTFDTGAGNTTTPSGLAQVASFATEPTANFTSLKVYGGDLLGNLWRFDINAASGTSPLKLATFKDDASTPQSQPIMITPTLTTIDNKRIVVIGTGKYIESSDLVAPFQTQSIYAFKDDDLTTTVTGNPRDSMVEQTLTTSLDGQSRTITNHIVNWGTKLGWYIDLGSGERQNIRSTLVSGILFVPTIVPSTGTCDVNGRGWLNAFDVSSGSVVPGHTLVSRLTLSPIAGITIVAETKPDGTVVIHGPLTCLADGSCPPPCVGAECDFAINAPGGFQNKRAIWRELVE